MAEQENQSNQPSAVLQVSMTDDDFSQFILGRPFNPQVLAIAFNKLNESELVDLQTHINGALNIVLNARLREVNDALNNVKDVDFEESEE